MQYNERKPEQIQRGANVCLYERSVAQWYEGSAND